MTPHEMRNQISEWVHAYLRYNNCEAILDVSLAPTLDQKRCVVKITTGSDTDTDSDGDPIQDGFFIDTKPILAMPVAEARMYVWGILANNNVVTAARIALTKRLEQAEDEYFEIMDAQALIEGKDPGEIQNLE